MSYCSSWQDMVNGITGNRLPKRELGQALSVFYSN